MTDEVRLWKENEELRKERDELARKLDIAKRVLVELAPKWKTCVHDYEPNTTMDFLRCEKCGARSAIVVALKEIEK